MRPGDRVCATCDIYDRDGDEVTVSQGTAGTIDELSMFGRSVLVDYDNGISLRQRTRHCRALPSEPGR